VECTLSRKIAVCILIDKSGSIENLSLGGAPGNYEIVKTFARSLVQGFADNSDESLFGVATFGTAADIDTVLVSESIADTTISSLQHSKQLNLRDQYTNTQDGFNKCNTILSNAPQGFSKIVALITDGDPTAYETSHPTSLAEPCLESSTDPMASCYQGICSPEQGQTLVPNICYQLNGFVEAQATEAANNAAQDLKSGGATIISVGIGSRVSKTKLDVWSSESALGSDLTFIGQFNDAALNEILSTIEATPFC